MYKQQICSIKQIENLNYQSTFINILFASTGWVKKTRNIDVIDNIFKNLLGFYHYFRHDKNKI